MIDSSPGAGEFDFKLCWNEIKPPKYLEIVSDKDRLKTLRAGLDRFGTLLLIIAKGMEKRK